MTKDWVDFKLVKQAVSMQMALDHYHINWLRKNKDELRGRCLFALAHLHGFCGRQRLPVFDPKELLAAHATAAPQALGARRAPRGIEMGFVPENGIGL